MVFADYIIISLLSFNAVSSPVNPSYDYGANINASQTLTTIVNPSSTNQLYYLTSKYTFTANLSFNDSSATSYEVTGIKMYFYFDLYWVDSVGNLTLEYSYNPVYNCPITYYNYSSSPFSDFYFSYALLEQDDEFVFNVSYNNEVVLHNDYECDYSINSYDSRCTYQIDGSYLNYAIVNGVQNNYEQTIAYNNGYSDGESAGYTSGYADGRNDTLAHNSTASEIFTGIVNIALLPINVFLGMLNIEVFDINIGAFITALLTVAITVILIRTITGKKND